MAKKTGAKKPRSAKARVQDLAEEIRFDEAAADLAERQNLADSDGEAQSFDLAGDDLDAGRRLGLGSAGNAAGQVPTPDQNQVDELGAAAGLTYADDA